MFLSKSFIACLAVISFFLAFSLEQPQSVPGAFVPTSITKQNTPVGLTFNVAVAPNTSNIVIERFKSSFERTVKEYLWPTLMSQVFISNINIYKNSLPYDVDIYLKEGALSSDKSEGITLGIVMYGYGRDQQVAVEKELGLTGKGLDMSKVGRDNAIIVFPRSLFDPSVVLPRTFSVEHIILHELLHRIFFFRSENSIKVLPDEYDYDSLKRLDKDYVPSSSESEQKSELCIMNLPSAIIGQTSTIPDLHLLCTSDGPGKRKHIDRPAMRDRSCWNFISTNYPDTIDLNNPVIPYPSHTAYTIVSNIFTPRYEHAQAPNERSIEVRPNPIVIASSSLRQAQEGVKYNTTLQADNVIGTAKWSIQSGALPKGLALSADGIISGVPEEDTRGNHSVTIKVQDSANSDSRQFNLKVLPRPLCSASTSAVSGKFGSIAIVACLLGIISLVRVIKT